MSHPDVVLVRDAGLMLSAGGSDVGCSRVGFAALRATPLSRFSQRRKDAEAEPLNSEF